MVANPKEKKSPANTLNTYDLNTTAGQILTALEVESVIAWPDDKRARDSYVLAHIIPLNEYASSPLYEELILNLKTTKIKTVREARKLFKARWKHAHAASAILDIFLILVSSDKKNASLNKAIGFLSELGFMSRSKAYSVLSDFRNSIHLCLIYNDYIVSWRKRNGDDRSAFLRDFSTEIFLQLAKINALREQCINFKLEKSDKHILGNKSWKLPENLIKVELALSFNSERELEEKIANYVSKYRDNKLWAGF